MGSTLAGTLKELAITNGIMAAELTSSKTFCFLSGECQLAQAQIIWV